MYKTLALSTNMASLIRPALTGVDHFLISRYQMDHLPNRAERSNATFMLSLILIHC